MNQALLQVIQQVDSHWTIDQKIRFLYVKLAPFFKRDLNFFLNDIEQQVIMYEKANTAETTLVFCKTICIHYVNIFKTLNIDCKMITTNRKITPHCALIVKGNDGWYYIDPLKDLFANQLGLKTLFFGTIPGNYSTVKNDFPYLIKLSKEYIKELDTSLGLISYDMYMDDFFELLHAEISTNKASEHFHLKNSDNSNLLYKKIEFIEKHLINLGQIHGLYERLLFYNHMIHCVFNKRERNFIDLNFISNQNEYALLCTFLSSKYNPNEIKFSETKNEHGKYCLKKVL